MVANEESRAGKVYLRGYDANGAEVFVDTLPFEDYYDELHPVIDDSSFRHKIGIRRLTGEIYDLDGQLQQRFENGYDSDGNLESGVAHHKDGTTTKHP